LPLIRLAAAIALPPFADMREKEDQEYFSNGLSEELIDLLSKIPDLRVPARTSSFYFKGKSQILLPENWPADDRAAAAFRNAIAVDPNYAPPERFSPRHLMARHKRRSSMALPRRRPTL
jgi:hypothetical protein